MHDDQTWIVPNHTIDEFSEKKTKYCIVIPVINEGARIQKQLNEMHALNIHEKLDIIMADGGSSDDSLNEQFLKEMNVRTLLTKRDKGKLSAQLRMALAYCLSQAYEGIVIIDGNGKDSVESIFKFIEALDNGIDYAQASRYIPGGQGINTPFVRQLAIKLLHAPVLSLAGKYRFTDTTQGFRAYSRKYLLDPAVQPFRGVFETYELLAYLTVRAGQLGYHVTEIPTVRTYPPKGKTPTKINAMGLVDLLMILAKTVFGCYTPGKPHAK